MTHLYAAIALLSLLAIGAQSEQLPRCSAALDGQMAEGGCECRHDTGGQLTGRGPRWHWSCDLLRGPGVTEQVAPAGLPSAELPSGFTYAPTSQPGGTHRPPRFAGPNLSP